MKKIACLFVMILFSSLTLTALANSSPPADANDQFIETAMKKFMHQHHVHGAVVEIYIDGKPHTYDFGLAYSGNKIQVEQNTIFKIGSLTSLFTCLVLAQELDEAKIKLDEPVRYYLRSLPSDFNEVSLQDLATQTGGLPSYPDEKDGITPDFKAFLPKAKLEYAISADWVYSPVGMGLLGAALADATNEKLGNLYQKRIFKLLGMRATGLASEMELNMYSAEGHDRDGNPIRSKQEIFFPGGDGLSTTGEDMRQFLGAAIGLPGTPERIAYPMRLTQSIFVKLPDRFQGLGWMIYPINNETIPKLLHAEEKMKMGPTEVEQIYLRPRYSGDMLLDQIGIGNGFRSYIGVIPNKRSGILIMTNKVVTYADIVNLGRGILFKVTKIKDDPFPTPPIKGRKNAW
jgi:beta-lactamase class C